MDIQFYNTLHHAVERFESIEPNKVRMYNCGPTVYDYAHIGNFRAFVFADVLRRFLELAGYDVCQVMNLTDVGHMTEDQLADGGGQDKMEVAAQRLKQAKKQGKADVQNPDDPYQVAQYFIDAFLEDGKLLGLAVANEYDMDPDKTRMPRATQFIDAMQTMIRALLERGHAYIAEDGAVYYDVQSFPEYGQLSGNTLDKLRGGAGGRVQGEHQAMKKHPADFLLWKSDKSHLMKWPSEWGEGYPGWHIECSAMARALHGTDVIDIHTGGEDNIFPHHECEIAQSRGATGEESFARYWMHTRFLLVEGEKMSKSKGNFFTVRDLLARGADPKAIRYELFKAHYRTNMNFTMQGLADSQKAVERLRNAQARWQKTAGDVATSDMPVQDHTMLRQFKAALADDLNMAGALGELFGWLANASADTPAQAQENLAVLQQVDRVLNVLEHATPPREAVGDDGMDVEAHCKAIDAARQAKDYAKADELRDALMAAGYEVKSGKEGTTATRKLQ